MEAAASRAGYQGCVQGKLQGLMLVPAPQAPSCFYWAVILDVVSDCVDLNLILWLSG